MRVQQVLAPDGGHGDLDAAPGRYTPPPGQCGVVTLPLHTTSDLPTLDPPGADRCCDRTVMMPGRAG